MDEKKPEPKASYGRREFFNFSWKVLGIALTAEAAWTSYDILAPKPAGAFGGMVDAGALIDLKPDAPPKYYLDGRFYLSRYKAGSQEVLVALYQKCPHLGCRIPYCDSSKQFECPCHGSVFNVAGEYIKGPAPRGMDQFKVIEQNGHAMVDTGKMVEGPPRGVVNGPSQPAGPACVSESGTAAATPGASPTATGSP